MARTHVRSRGAFERASGGETKLSVMRRLRVRLESDWWCNVVFWDACVWLLAAARAGAVDLMGKGCKGVRVKGCRFACGAQSAAAVRRDASHSQPCRRAALGGGGKKKRPTPADHNRGVRCVCGGSSC